MALSMETKRLTLLEATAFSHKEGGVPKNWSFRIVVLEKTLENLLDSKEIKLANPKGTQS